MDKSKTIHFMLDLGKMMKEIYNNFDIHFYRLVHIASHSDHVTVRHYVLILASVPDINVYMNAVMDIFDLVLLDALVSFIP